MGMKVRGNDVLGIAQKLAAHYTSPSRVTADDFLAQGKCDGQLGPQRWV